MPTRIVLRWNHWKVFQILWQWLVRVQLCRYHSLMLVRTQEIRIRCWSNVRFPHGYLLLLAIPCYSAFPMSPCWTKTIWHLTVPPRFVAPCIWSKWHLNLAFMLVASFWIQKVVPNWKSKPWQKCALHSTLYQNHKINCNLRRLQNSYKSDWCATTWATTKAHTQKTQQWHNLHLWALAQRLWKFWMCLLLTTLYVVAICAKTSTRNPILTMSFHPWLIPCKRMLPKHSRLLKSMYEFFKKIV